MYIKEIELQNFKSFKHKTRIPFFNDFTTISGPNGSGKSNIIDAILFVLGLSTSRLMRAEKLTDLIYNANGRNNPNFAEVTIRFDNTDREVPLDRDEITVTRKVQRTNDGGYYSYYYLNNRACNLSDIHTYLSKARISPDGYNIIMQGDVTYIIEMSSVERRKLIDEIAGVAEFDAKKKQSLSELETVWERIERVDIVLSEVGIRLMQLQEERGQALKYKALMDENRRYEAFTLLSKLKSVEDELKKSMKKLDGRNLKKDGLAKELTEIRGRISTVDEKLRVLNEEITLKGEDEQIEVKKEIEEIKGEIAKHQHAIGFFKTEIGSIEEGRRKALIEIDKTREKIESLTAKIGDEEVRKGGILAEIKEKEAQLKTAQDKTAKVDAKFADVRSRLTTLKEQLEGGKNERSELFRAKDRLLDSIRRKSSEEGDIKREIERSKEQIAETEVMMKRVHKELKDLEEERTKVSSSVDELESKKSALKGELDKIEQELWKRQQEYVKIEARVKASEELGGYSRAVSTILNAKKQHELSGIYGVIAELGKVDEKCASAIEVAAGNRMQCVVVDVDEDAACAIEFLKNKKCGRVTFLPLNKMKTRSLPKLTKKDGVIDYAINLVDYDAKFEPVFQYVFGDTIVVENLDIARKLMPGRMVTLDGELIERSGAMTGGSLARRFAFTTAEKSLKKLAEQVTVYETKRRQCLDKIDAIEGEISSIQRGTLDIDTEIAGKKRRLVEGEELINTSNEVIKAKEEGLASIMGERKKLGEEMNAMEEKCTSMDSQIAETDEEIKKLEKLLKDSEIPGLMKEAEDITTETRRLENRIRDIDAEIGTINVEKNFSSSKINELKERTKELEEKKKQLREQVSTGEEEIVTLEGKLEDKKQREKTLEGELVDLRGKRNVLLEEMSKIDAEKNDVQKQLERIDAQIEMLEAGKNELQAQFDAIKKEVDETGVAKVDEVPPHDVVVEKIASLKAQMAELEPVNMRAIAEYEEVETRQRDLQSKRDVLFKEHNDIIERIERYESMKKDAFMQSFCAINAHFKEIFADLSDGEGELVLENWDDPFAGGLTIKARPSGKAVRRMSALSGGEKSLTALAFLFAIQRHRPAPFYALDEIDMYLDGANAERVASMIKNISKGTQFIVVSLRESMVRAANRTIGVTMQEENISSITGVVLN